MAKQQLDIRRWARVGAEQRLVQIAEEAAAIHRAFPELRRGGGAGRGRRSGGSASRAGDESAGSRGGARKRGRSRKRTMSAEARKRISDAQKARWAKHRGAQGTGAGTSGSAKKR